MLRFKNPSKLFKFILYLIKKGKNQQYCWNEDQRQRLVHEWGGGNEGSLHIQRYKGLGEMNAEQLWDTTMNPRTRTLIQVNIEDLADADQRIKVLMGDKVEPRRDWIEANVSFSSEDNFRIGGK